MADQFRQLVWDADGEFRLNSAATLYNWAVFRDGVANHYGFNETQKAQAQANYAKAVEQYDWVWLKMQAILKNTRWAANALRNWKQMNRKKRFAMVLPASAAKEIQFAASGNRKRPPLWHKLIRSGQITKSTKTRWQLQIKARPIPTTAWPSRDFSGLTPV